MTRHIDQFMWPYQHVFRTLAERALQRALDAVVTGVRAELFLVGFAANSDAPGWPVCVEPEDGPFHPRQLLEVEELGRQIYERDPESKMQHSVARVHDARHRELGDRSRARALQQRLAELDTGHAFEVGPSTKVGDYHIHPVARLAGWDAVARLRTSVCDRFQIAVSLPDAVVEEAFRLCRLRLSLPDAGTDLNVLGAETWDIQRAAGANVCRSAAMLTGQPSGPALMDDLSGVSNLAYEGRPPAGEFVLAHAGHPLVQERLVLRDPVPLQRHLAVRKLLEMARGGLCLLTDGETIRALGTYDEPAHDDPEDLFVVRISGTGAWQMRHGAVPLVRLLHGTATVPKERLSRDGLVELAGRLLGGSGAPVDAEALWSLLSRAVEQVRGTMIVVSTAAADEAARLRPQATGIRPAVLDEALLSDATSIDGGVLLDPTGRCHAIGVILDGVARDHGDPARGSRYNSAVRYLEGGPPPCLILVVSADGMVDVLPHLQPRVARSEVLKAVSRVVAEASADKPSPERFSKAWDRLNQLRFYVDGEQAACANEAVERMNERGAATGMMLVRRAALRPDPGMSEEYFTDP